MQERRDESAHARDDEPERDATVDGTLLFVDHSDHDRDERYGRRDHEEYRYKD